MPRIFDNIEQYLRPALADTMHVAHRADFCVGYFNLRGWRSIDADVQRWPGGEGHCCRILVGMQRLPHEELRAAGSLASGRSDLDNQTALRLKKRLAGEFREQLTLGAPTNQDEAGLRRLARQLNARKVVVKLFLRHPLHAKLYLLFRSDPINPIVGYLGSSNLTQSGLSLQGELNVDVLDNDACQKLVSWFEERWNDRWCVDISDELAAIIEESWAREQLIPPHHIYVKIAYHLSQEARSGLTEFRIPRDFGNQLLDFQTAAVKIAAHHLNKRGGVLIGDVVGLGKTLMATALARVFEDDHGLETLIICPKNLVPMWEDHRERYRMRARVLSMSRVLADLPDLRRYRLVLIDESHNLRNREGQRYRAIQEYIRENESRCILLSATPYNKTYLDLSNQLRLYDSLAWIDRDRRSVTQSQFDLPPHLLLLAGDVRRGLGHESVMGLVTRERRRVGRARRRRAGSAQVSMSRIWRNAIAEDPALRRRIEDLAAGGGRQARGAAGAAPRQADRSPEMGALLGRVPYLNGGLFDVHDLERDNADIHILDDLGRSRRKYRPEKLRDFREALAEVDRHASERYFILKSIVIGNLYGVDIMEEAVEICKLRLFLKLVSQLERYDQIEPLPDIDFNVRAGNTLVGFTSLEEVKRALGSNLIKQLSLPDIEERAEIADRAFSRFRAMQTEHGLDGGAFIEAKAELRRRLDDLRDELDGYLAREYGVKSKADFRRWRASHQPFHWFVEFYGVMHRGGFDVLIGNPPYVEYSKVREEYRVQDLATIQCGNLYALCTERSLDLLAPSRWFGFIVQAPIVSTQRMSRLRELVHKRCGFSAYATFDDRPSKLFNGMHHCRVCIVLCHTDVRSRQTLTTKYHKWYREERYNLLALLHYQRLGNVTPGDVIPKLRSDTEQSILRKILSRVATLGSTITGARSEHRIYYKITGVGHWFTFTTSPPRFWRAGVEASSTRESSVCFSNGVARDTAFCRLWSTLHYWLYQARDELPRLQSDRP